MEGERQSPRALEVLTIPSPHPTAPPPQPTAPRPSTGGKGAGAGAKGKGGKGGLPERFRPLGLDAPSALVGGSSVSVVLHMC